MGRGPERTVILRRHENDQQIYENVLKVTSHTCFIEFLLKLVKMCTHGERALQNIHAAQIVHTKYINNLRFNKKIETSKEQCPKI